MERKVETKSGREKHDLSCSWTFHALFDVRWLSSSRFSVPPWPVKRPQTGPRVAKHQLDGSILKTDHKCIEMRCELCCDGVMSSKRTPSRQLVATDVENLLGSANPTEQEVVQIRCHLIAIVQPDHDAMFEVACSHRAAAAIRFGFPNGHHVWRSGPNGADLALLDILTVESVADRFDRVVIASGDGIFAPVAARLAEQGVHCTVVSRRSALSTRLALAAARVIILDDHGVEGATAHVA